MDRVPKLGSPCRMSGFILSPTTSLDLEEILDYLCEADIDIGENLLTEFNKKCRTLVHFSNMGRSYGHLAPSLRGLLIRSYISFRRSTDTGIEIVRVVRGYRDPPSLFEEES